MEIDKPEAVLALDQSTAVIGHSTWINGKLESYSQFKPDFPRLDFLRSFVKDYCNEFAREGYRPVVVCEDIFYGKNVLVYRTLATLMGHIQAATFDSGGDFYIATANKALEALTGIVTSPRNPIKRDERKALMMEFASKITGVEIPEDTADSIGLGMAHLRGFSRKVM